MFRQLIAIFKKADRCREMYDRLVAMVHTDENMLQSAWECAVAGAVPPEVKEQVYKWDIDVNRGERDIRKRIMEHLKSSPGVDVPASLILMSLVKDAERIGDFCKNVLEAATLVAGPLSTCPFADRFGEVYGSIREAFGKTRRALSDADEIVGQEVIVEERHIARQCDTLIERAAALDLTSRHAVPWALLARYLKRVSAHLGNMASSLAMPLHKLDYFDEKLMPGQEKENASE